MSLNKNKIKKGLMNLVGGLIFISIFGGGIGGMAYHFYHSIKDINESRELRIKNKIEDGRSLIYYHRQDIITNKASILGISHLRENIRDIYEKDFNKDGKLDFQVYFNGGKIVRYYNKGYEEK